MTSVLVPTDTDPALVMSHSAATCHEMSRTHGQLSSPRLIIQTGDTRYCVDIVDMSVTVSCLSVPLVQLPGLTTASLDLCTWTLVG